MDIVLCNHGKVEVDRMADILDVEPTGRGCAPRMASASAARPATRRRPSCPRRSAPRRYRIFKGPFSPRREDTPEPAGCQSCASSVQDRGPFGPFIGPTRQVSGVLASRASEGQGGLSAQGLNRAQVERRYWPPTLSPGRASSDCGCGLLVKFYVDELKLVLGDLGSTDDDLTINHRPDDVVNCVLQPNDMNCFPFHDDFKPVLVQLHAT